MVGIIGMCGVDVLDTDGASLEQFDPSLVEQKDKLEKDARREFEEILASRLNLPAEMESLIQDVVNKNSSTQVENVEFERNETEDTGKAI